MIRVIVYILIVVDLFYFKFDCSLMLCVLLFELLFCLRLLGCLLYLRVWLCGWVVYLTLFWCGCCGLVFRCCGLVMFGIGGVWVVF